MTNDEARPVRFRPYPELPLIGRAGMVVGLFFLIAACTAPLRLLMAGLGNKGEAPYWIGTWIAGSLVGLFSQHLFVSDALTSFVVFLPGGVLAALAVLVSLARPRT